MMGGGNVIPFPGTGNNSNTGEQCPPSDPDDPSDCELWFNDLNVRLTQLYFNHTKRPMNDIELAAAKRAWDEEADRYNAKCVPLGYDVMTFRFRNQGK